MRLATWNVNSVTARLPLVLRWLEAARPDVICMQETKCMDDRFPHDAFKEIGYCCAVFGQQSYNGVAILSRGNCENVQRGFAEDGLDAQARLLAASVQGIRIINVYIPNGGFVGSDKYVFKLEWMKRLHRLFELCYDANLPIALCGDFNVAPEEIDVYNPDLWRGQIMFSDPERAALAEIKKWGFVDVFRLHNPSTREFTWWDYRAGSFRRNLGLRIDHIFMSRTLAPRCTAAWIDKTSRGWERPSDHAPVLAEIDIPAESAAN